jgi:hypothetical protein
LSDVGMSPTYAGAHEAVPQKLASSTPKCVRERAGMRVDTQTTMQMAYGAPGAELDAVRGCRADGESASDRHARACCVFVCVCVCVMGALHEVLFFRAADRLYRR